MMVPEQFTVASFFSGCGGFDLGFKQEGYKIVLASDIWKTAVETYKLNFPETYVVQKDIRTLTERELKIVLKKAGIKKIDVVIGGPPCQCFTRMNNNNLSMKDERNSLFRNYIAVIRKLRPRFVVMENVADLLVRKDENGRKFVDMICRSFNRAGYHVKYHVFKTELYGVPQKRRRVIFIASQKKDMNLTFPKGSKRKCTVGPCLKKIQGKRNLENNKITVNQPGVLERIKHIPPGGYYEHLPDYLKTVKVRKGKPVIVKRYGSYYRRLDSDQPAITFTNNYLIHPEENRFITNREMAVLHTFPVDFKFLGNLDDVGQMIANAVPPEMARRIAAHLKQYLIDKEANRGQCRHVNR
jgi:DNA (cytosine-5)-methyltransferase 1